VGIRASHPIVAASLWMCITIVSFVGMAIGARELIDTMSAFEILAIRSAIGLTILSVYIFFSGKKQHRTKRPLVHFGRNMIHFWGQCAWVASVGLLPLAQVFALEFTVPVWIAILAVVFLGEKLTSPRIVAVIGGFIGVLIILRPGMMRLEPGVFLVLFAALCFASTTVITKTLTKTEGVVTILFFMTFIQLILGTAITVFNWVTPTLADIPWLIVVGITGMSAHLGITNALRIADASSISPIDFLRLPTIAIVGYFLYDEAIDIWVLAGAVVMFSANYYNLRKEYKPTVRVQSH